MRLWLTWWWRLCTGDYDNDEHVLRWWERDRLTYIPELALATNETEEQSFLSELNRRRQVVFSSCLILEIASFGMSIGLAVIFEDGPIWPSLSAVGLAFVFDHVKSKNKRFHARHNRYARIGSPTLFLEREEAEEPH